MADKKTNKQQDKSPPAANKTAAGSASRKKSNALFLNISLVLVLGCFGAGLVAAKMSISTAEMNSDLALQISSVADVAEKAQKSWINWFLSPDKSVNDMVSLAESQMNIPLDALPSLVSRSSADASSLGAINAELSKLNVFRTNLSSMHKSLTAPNGVNASSAIALNKAYGDLDASIREIHKLLLEVPNPYTMMLYASLFLGLVFSVGGMVLIAGLAQELKQVKGIKGFANESLQSMEALSQDLRKLHIEKDGQWVPLLSQRLNINSRQSVGKLARGINDLWDGVSSFSKKLNQQMGFIIESEQDTVTALDEAHKKSKASLELVDQYSNKLKRLSDLQAEFVNKSQDIIKTINVLNENSSKSLQSTLMANAKMSSVRDSIQESSKKIKRVGESATGASQAIDLIGMVTKQIHVLALNTAIQASHAGDSGRQFSAIAKEIERLAKNTDEAAKKVDGLIINIQDDAKAAVSSMENSTSDVVEGSKIIEESKKSLDSLKGSGESMSQGIVMIQASSKQQESIAREAVEDFAESVRLLQESLTQLDASAKAMNKGMAVAQEQQKWLSLQEADAPVRNG